MAESDPERAAGGTVEMHPDAEPEGVYDVFLSYNSRDRKVVQRISRELEKRGIRVWADWKMSSGSVWLTELEKIIRQIKVAAFFVGPYGLGEWHDNERQAFHIRRTRIIPVLLPGAPADFEPPLFLHRHSWIDFRTPGKIVMSRHKISVSVLNLLSGMNRVVPLAMKTVVPEVDSPYFLSSYFASWRILSLIDPGSDLEPRLSPCRRDQVDNHFVAD